MSATYEKYGFYRIDISYVKYLHSIDSQVHYDPSDPQYDRKPYLGIVADIGGHKYCIPLTSGKSRHLNWYNVTEHNYVVYENVVLSEIHPKDVYRRIKNTELYKKIIAVLEIRKMIPICEGLYTYIDFPSENDQDYRNLLEKEYRFLKPLKDKILHKAERLYELQARTGKIKDCYCNFRILEQAFKEYNQ